MSARVKMHTPVNELPVTTLADRDSCALLLASGDQLKPSGGIRGAKLLSEPVELENRGFRWAPSCSLRSALPTDRQCWELLCRLIITCYIWCLWISTFCFCVFLVVLFFHSSREQSCVIFICIAWLEHSDSCAMFYLNLISYFLIFFTHFIHSCQISACSSHKQKVMAIHYRVKLCLENDRYDYSYFFLRASSPTNLGFGRLQIFPPQAFIPLLSFNELPKTCQTFNL